jgi:uncharacterized protein YjcR
MGKRAEKEQDAIRLYAEGNEIPAIAAEIGVSENSLREWKRRAGSEWDEARSICRKGFVASMEDVGARLRRSREVAAALGGKAGLQNQGQMGQVVNELLRSLLYDLSTQVDPTGNMDATIDQIKSLALTMQRLETAAARNIKNEQEIRKQILEQAVQTVEKTAKQAGVSAETIQAIRRDVLMMAT